MSPRLCEAARAAAAAVDPAALIADLAGLVRIRSVTGDEDAIAVQLADRLETLGLDVEVFHPDPAAIRADPDWPGEEVARTIAAAYAMAPEVVAAAKETMAGK